MLANETKAKLIAEISGHARDTTVRNLIALIDIIVAETRIENDRCSRLSHLRNQGKVEGLQSLKDTIERGLPGQ